MLTTFKLAAIDPLKWNAQPPVIPRRFARIGIAKAAFFPVVRLTGSGGFVSGDIESLFNWESRIWSIGRHLAADFCGREKYRESESFPRCL